MAEDVESNIRIDIDAASALAELKNLQRQISAFHTSLAKGSADAAAASGMYQQKLINAINRTGQFSAEVAKVTSTSEAFTTALEKNKLSLGQYFKFAGGASKTFGSMFKSEMATIDKVARERVKTLQTQYIQLGRDASGAMRAIKVRPLMLDMDNLATKTQIAAQKQQIFNQLLKQGSTQLLNFGKNTQWAGRQLMVGFTVPLTMFGTVATKAFMEMEKSVIAFKRVYGETFTSSAETDKMLGQVKALAKEFTKYGVAVADTMTMAAEAAAQGKMGADLLAQVNNAARLSVLGQVSQQEALTTTISLTNAFGTAAEDLAGKINFLNAVENQTATSISDLTIAIPKAAPVVKQLGGDVQDLTFFLTAMKEGGINASEGANALKSGLASMINPTRQASEFMAKFGVSISGIVESNKGDVKGMVIGLAQALDKLDPLNRARAIEQMFGKFQFARMSTLFQNVIKDGSQAQKVLDLAKASQAELAVLSEREMKRISDSPMYKFQKSIEDLKVSLVPLGEAFVKAITPIAQFATKILDKFNGLDEGAKTFVTNLVGIIGVIAPAFLMGFGLIANGVANIIKLFGTIKGAYNRALGSTDELGVQTDYMTQAQLEAQAAAASLDQVHSTLVQTFTSEAIAVASLKTAYEQATMAQNAFQGSNPSMFPDSTPGFIGPKRKGFAKGGLVVSGPGGPTSDSVPANLSNGEVVLSVDTVNKNPGVVAGLMNGQKINVPGYASPRGGSVVGNVAQLTNPITGQAVPINITAQMADTGSLGQQGVGRLQTVIEGMADGGIKIANAEAAVERLLQTLKDLPKVTGDIFKREMFNAIDDANVAAGGKPGEALDRFEGNSVNTYLGKRKAKALYETGELTSESTSKEIKRRSRTEFIERQDTSGKSIEKLAMGDAEKTTQIARTRAGSQAARDAYEANPERYAQVNPARMSTSLVKAHKIGTNAASKGTDAAWTDPAAYNVQDTLLNSFSEYTRSNTGFVNAYMEELKAMGNEMQAGPERDKFITHAIEVQRKVTEGLALSEQELATQEQVLDRVVQKAGGLDGTNLTAEQSAYRSRFGKDETQRAGVLQSSELVQIDSRARRAAAPAMAGEGANTPKQDADLQRKILEQQRAALPAAEVEKLAVEQKKNGKNIATGIASGLEEAAPVVIESGRVVSGQLDQSIKDFWGIASPSKKGWNFGKNIAEGIANGMTDNSGLVSSASSGLNSAADDPFAQSIPGVDRPNPFENYEEPKSGMRGKLSGMGTGIANKAGEFGLKAASALKEKALDIGDTVGVGLARYLSAGTATLTDRKGNVRYNADTGETLNAKGETVGVQDVRVVADNTDVPGNNNSTTMPPQMDADGNPVSVSSAEEARVRQQQRSKKILGTASKIGMGISGLSMAAGMLPGEIGQQAQQWIMPMMTISSILPMLSSKMGAAAVGVGALVAAFMFAQAKFNEAQQKSMDMIDSLSATNDNIKKLGESTGRATAGETADKMRSMKYDQFQIQPGKKTFGETFIEGETGKSMIKGVADVVANGGGRNVAKSQLMSQLTTGVASGAITAAEARSIAANVGKQLGDRAFGIQVNAKMLELLGPNGENLEKDPIGIRVRMMEESGKQVGAGNKLISSAAKITGTDVLMQGGGILGGAGAGAAAGAIAGSVIPGVGNVVGAVAGGIIGAVAGGIMGAVQRSERIAKATGAAVAMQRAALEQQQEMIDSLDVTYQKKIDEAKAAGDVAKAEKLTNEYIEARAKMLTEQGKTSAAIVTSYENATSEVQGALDSGADKAIDKKFKGTANEDLAGLVKDDIKNANLTNAQDNALRVQFSTGNLDPMLLANFLGQFGQDAGVMTQTMTIMTKLGGTGLSEVMNVAALFQDENGDPLVEQQTEFIAQISAMTSTEAQKYLDVMAQVQKVGTAVPFEIVGTFYEKNPAARKAIMGAIDKINAIKGKISVAATATVIGNEAMNALNQNADYFNRLPAEMQKVYLQTMTTLWQLKGDPEFIADWKLWRTQNPGTTMEDYINNRAVAVTEEAKATGSTVSKTPDTTGGSGPSASFLDEYLKKLRDLRNATVKVKEGFSAALKEINKWFAGNNTINKFDGIKNQMRKLGLGEDLIEAIAGMDPKEFEKRKNDLFKIEKGRIVGLKDNVQSIQDALNSIKAGEWNDSLESQKKQTEDQSKAFSRLRAAGMSVAEAYATIEDKSLAQMIASKELTDKELEAIVKKNEALKNTLALIEKTRAVEQKTTDVKDRAKMLSASLSDKTFTKDQMALIMQDDTLREAYATMIKPGVDPVELERAKKVILDAVDPKNFKLNLANDLIEKLQSGLPGLEEIFNDGFSKAQEKFNAEEKKLQITADIKMKPFNDKINIAQDKIAAIQYQLDDYDAGLKKIADQEENINKAYDKKLEALDKVQKANDMISRQQKNQLSLASALASGDIAAAARAAQEIKAQEAQDALQRQKNALEESKKAQIESLTTTVLVNGTPTVLSRKQIEDNQKSLNDQVDQIQEIDLEPAQEQVRQIQVTLRDAVDALTVNGMSKIQWDQLQNGVDIAKTSSEAFAAAIKNATTVVEDLKTAWGKEIGLTIDQAKTIVNEGGTAGVAGVEVAAVNAPSPSLTTNNSSSGNGNSNGGNVPPPSPPPSSAYQTSFADISKFSYANARGGKIGQVLGTMDDYDVNTAYAAMSNKFLNAEDALYTFKENNASKIVDKKGESVDVFDEASGMTIKDIGTRNKWKELFNTYAEAEKTGLKYKYLSKSSGGITVINQDSTSQTAGKKAFKEDYLKPKRTEIIGRMAPEVLSRINWLQDAQTLYTKDFGVYKTAYSKIASALQSVNVNPYTEGIPYAKSDAATYKKFVAAIGGEAALTQELAKIKGPSATLQFGVNKANEYRQDLITAGYTKEVIEKIFPGSGKNMDKVAFPFDGTGASAAYKLKKYAYGGMVLPQKFVAGGFAEGTDTVPAMLTPGEFIISKSAADRVGQATLKSINSGTYNGETVYTYNLSVNVQSESDPNEIAKVVLSQIQRVDDQRLRGNRY